MNQSFQICSKQSHDPGYLATNNSIPGGWLLAQKHCHSLVSKVFLISFGPIPSIVHLFNSPSRFSQSSLGCFIPSTTSGGPLAWQQEMLTPHCTRKSQKGECQTEKMSVLERLKSETSMGLNKLDREFSQASGY